MKNGKIIICGFLAALLLFAACPGDDGGGNNVLSVALLDEHGEAFSAERIDGTIGGTVRFSAEVQVLNGASRAVIWKVSGGNGKSNITAGLLGIAADETHGTILTVTVSAQADTGKSASIRVLALKSGEPRPPDLYAVTLGTFTDGSVSVRDNLTEAERGTVITLDIAPNIGYRLDTLTVKRATSDATVSVRGSGNTRTFTMPSAAVTVNATFAVSGGPDPNSPYFTNAFDTSLCSFYDKFDGTGLDLNKWGYQNGNGQQPDNYGTWAWGNEEKQSYHPSGVTVANGILSLTVRKEARNSMQYTSGKIVTANSKSEPGTKFAQTYGRFEAKIRLTKAEQGIWPAFWMMPVTSDYGGWPRSGEIDIMEMVGRTPNHASSTIHFQARYGEWQGRQYRGTEHRFMNDSDFTDWHVYGAHWTPTEMIFLIDGMEHRRIPSSIWNSSFYSTDSAPFDRDFHLILNLAVGGNFDGGRLPDDGALPISLEVDWVRAYTLDDNPWPITGTVPRSHVRDY